MLHFRPSLFSKEQILICIWQLQKQGKGEANKQEDPSHMPDQVHNGWTRPLSAGHTTGQKSTLPDPVRSREESGFPTGLPPQPVAKSEAARQAICSNCTVPCADSHEGQHWSNVSTFVFIEGASAQLGSGQCSQWAVPRNKVLCADMAVSLE